MQKARKFEREGVGGGGRFFTERETFRLFSPSL